MSTNAAEATAPRLREANRKLDALESRLDQIEDLLEEIWDRVVEPVRAEPGGDSPG